MVAVHVVVVGCGRVGSELAAELEAQGHTVAVIDKNRNAFRRLPERFTGRAVLGFGFDRDHLEQAGVRDAGALAAVTSGDNSNILTARIARGEAGRASPEIVGQEGDLLYMAVRRDSRDELDSRLAEEGRDA